MTPGAVPEVGWIVVFTAVLTWAYSAPPLRARNSWWLGPLVIAIPRGLLLKVAGWGTLAPVTADREPWILGAVFFFYVLGAAPTKDFADVEGDRAGGSESLPIRFGRARSPARMIAPFLCLPGVLLALLPRIHVSGRPLLSMLPLPSLIAGIAIGAHGLWIARLLVTAGAGTQDRRGRPPLVAPHVPADDGAAGRGGRPLRLLALRCPDPPALGQPGVFGQCRTTVDHGYHGDESRDAEGLRRCNIAETSEHHGPFAVRQLRVPPVSRAKVELRNTEARHLGRVP